MLSIDKIMVLELCIVHLQAITAFGYPQHYFLPFPFAIFDLPGLLLPLARLHAGLSTQIIAQIRSLTASGTLNLSILPVVCDSCRFASAKSAKAWLSSEIRCAKEVGKVEEAVEAIVVKAAVEAAVEAAIEVEEVEMEIAIVEAQFLYSKEVEEANLANLKEVQLRHGAARVQAYRAKLQSKARYRASNRSKLHHIDTTYRQSFKICQFEVDGEVRNQQ
jgi:hypothetical protein